MAVTAAGITSADRSHLERTVALGWEARNRGDHPFGSLLVVADGRVLEAHNSVVTGVDPTGHAETNLVRLRDARPCHPDHEHPLHQHGAVRDVRRRDLLVGYRPSGLRTLGGRLAEMVEEEEGVPRCICRVGRSSPEAAARSWSTVRSTWLPRPRSTRGLGPRILRVASSSLDPATYLT